MSEPFIGEIKLFSGSFAIRGWAFCNGATLDIVQNQALFSILGTAYGGDGRSTFGLPDLRGRAAVGAGQGPDFENYQRGTKAGDETVTLTTSNMPSHTHQAIASTSPPFAGGGSKDASNNLLGLAGASIYGNSSNLVAMANDCLTQAGGTDSVDNMQPFLPLNFLIALDGIYPARS